MPWQRAEQTRPHYDPPPIMGGNRELFPPLWGENFEDLQIQNT
mgnify:CR=1 FL=1